MANTIKLKRSAVAGKQPTTNDLALGELGLNTYDGKLFTKKSVSGTESIVEIGAGGIQYTFSATPPASPAIGDEWTDSDDGITYKYINDGNSSQWVEFGPAGGGSGGSGGPIVETSYLISQDVTLGTNKHGLSLYSVEVAAGYSVTVPAGATWTIADL